MSSGALVARDSPVLQLCSLEDKICSFLDNAVINCYVLFHIPSSSGLVKKVMVGGMLTPLFIAH
jgi:hypothetical protein